MLIDDVEVAAVRFGNRKRALEADRLRVEFLDAVNRGDLEGALRIATERLLPLSEDLAEASDDFLNPLGVTLRNMSAICVHLGRPVGRFYFAQRSLHVAVLVEARGRALHEALADTAGIAAEAAAGLAGKGSPRRGELSPADEELLLPAAALVPRSIEVMGELDSFAWACQLRLAVTKLRMLSYRDLKLVACEVRAMVWLARVALDLGERKTATAEIGGALSLWIDQLGSTTRYWSRELGETWTVAAQVLNELGQWETAVAVQGAIQQATRGFAAADLRPHYQAARAALLR